LVTIDIHSHLFHPKWYPAAFGVSLVRDFAARTRDAGRSVPANIKDTLFRLLADDKGVTTVKTMDKVGIARRVILVIDWGPALGEPSTSIREVHREILAVCNAFPDRLVGFAGIDPRRAEATDLLRWAFDDLHAAGLKLHPTSDWGLDDPRTHQVVSLAAERGLPVLVHIGRTLDILNQRHAQPEALIALAEAFPATRFIAGHSGFESWRRFIADCAPNVHFDVSGWQGWFARDPEQVSAELKAILTTFPGRVHFGSDGPFFTYNSVAAEQAWLATVRAAVSDSGLADTAGAAVFNPEFIR
jgi:predicted TIM-barrel fold metal-dependent hydrolase